MIVKAVGEPGSDHQEAKNFFHFFLFFLGRGSCLLFELVELVVVGDCRVNGPDVLGQELGVVPKLVSDILIEAGYVEIYRRGATGA